MSGDVKAWVAINGRRLDEVHPAGGEQRIGATCEALVLSLRALSRPPLQPCADASVSGG